MMGLTRMEQSPHPAPLSGGPSGSSAQTSDVPPVASSAPPWGCGASPVPAPGRRTGSVLGGAGARPGAGVRGVASGDVLLRFVGPSPSGPRIAARGALETRPRRHRLAQLGISTSCKDLRASTVCLPSVRAVSCVSQRGQRVLASAALHLDLARSISSGVHPPRGPQALITSSIVRGKSHGVGVPGSEGVPAARPSGPRGGERLRMRAEGPAGTAS